MTIPSSLRPLVTIIGIGISYCFLVFLVHLLLNGSREITSLENIHGIPFVRNSNGIIVTETLAHADVLLKESRLAKQLTLTISFIPHTVKRLTVGVRQDPFWLSYEPLNIYESSDGSGEAAYTRTVTFPLTAAIQDTDNSLDVMFFADYQGLGQEDLGAADTTSWVLQSVTAKVTPVLPSWTETKAFIRSVISHERPL